MTNRRFEAVEAYPAGSSTVARFAMTTAEIGFDGLVVRNGDAIDGSPSVEAVANEYELEVVRAVELKPEAPDDVSGSLPGLSERYPLVALVGGTTRINRFVATQRHVDVLARPITPTGPRLDPGTVANAVEHDVAVELDLGPLRTTGGTRVRYLQRLRSLWRVVDHYDAPYVVSFRPTSHLELRGPRHLEALGATVGIDPDAIDRGLERWATIADDDRQRGGSSIGNR